MRAVEFSVWVVGVVLLIGQIYYQMISSNTITIIGSCEKEYTGRVFGRSPYAHEIPMPISIR